MNGNLGTLSNGSLGFDVTTPLNAVSAGQYIRKNFQFVVRYVGRDDGSTRFTDLTPEEGLAIIGAGLALGVVQHPLAQGWAPSSAVGQRFGAAAARLVGAAGVIPGITIWLDLEGVATGTAPQDVIDYCNAWHGEVAAAGFTPGLYIGADPGLSADQLYWDLRMTSYWRGGSDSAAGVPATIPNRGYQMTQRIPPAGTVPYDTNVTTADIFGGTVKWWTQ